MIGKDKHRVDDTVKMLSNHNPCMGSLPISPTGRWWRMSVSNSRMSTWMPTCWSMPRASWCPSPFMDHDGELYDSFLELDRAIFFITQTVARGMIDRGRGGSIVNIGSMWAHQAVAATPSSAYSLARGGLQRASPAIWRWSSRRTKSGLTL